MGADDRSNSGGLTAGAEAAFASFLVRVDRGEVVDFDAFCTERPDVADSLRILHGRWLTSKTMADRANVQSVRDFLRTRGDDANVDLDPSAVPREPARPDSGIRARLEGLSHRAGRYMLRDEIARGGMGVILEVWDQDLRRSLAMKATFGAAQSSVGSDAPDAEVEMVGRFLEEAQITGQLDHPGVVPVHELGIDADGRLFFTMRYVRGQTLDEVIELVRAGKDGWTVMRAVDVVIRVCETLAYAHSKGVIHRDIKPANVMIGKFGEVYLMDWGLAKVVGRKDRHGDRMKTVLGQTQILTDRAEHVQESPDSHRLTMQGMIVGTPSYMPPEQAEGRVDDLDHRSDIYAAGALLYTLLTGRMPYIDPNEPATLHGLLSKIFSGPPQAIAEIDSTMPPELIAISDKAMARAPEDRYDDVLKMAHDLRAFNEGRVVSAYETGAAAELRKWVKRNKAIAVTAAALVLVTISGLVILAWNEKRRADDVSTANSKAQLARVHAENSARRAVANAKTASENAHRAQQESYLASLAAAHASLRLHDTREAKRLLAKCPERFRGWEWRHLLALTDSSESLLGAHNARVTALALSADGRRVVSGSLDKSVRLWDIESAGVLFTLPGNTEEVTALAFNPQGTRIVGAAKDMLVRIWDPDAGRILGTLPAQETAVRALAFHPDGNRLAVASDDGVRLWDITTFQKLGRFAPDEVALAVAFSDDGTRIVVGGEEGVKIWDVAGQTEIHAIETDDVVNCATANASVAVVGLDDGAIHIIELESGDEAMVLTGHADPVTSVSLVAGNMLVSTARDRTVCIWDLEAEEIVATLHGHDEPILSAAAHRNGTRVVTGGAGGRLRLWDAARSRAVHSLRGDEDFLSAVAFHPDGGFVAAASAGHGEIRIWNPTTGEPIRVIPESGGGLSSLAISTDGRWLVAGGEEDSTVRVHDARTGALVRTLKGHEASVKAVAISPDGTRIASGSSDNTTRVWMRESGAELQKLRGQTGHVVSVAFSADGAYLASGSLDGSVFVRRTGNPRAEKVLRENDGAVLAVRFAPDGSLVTAGMDGRIRIWDISSETPLTVSLAGHTGAVTSLAFSPDGTRLVSGGRDKMIRIWDLVGRRALLRMPAHHGWVTSVAWSADGSKVASCSFDTTAKIWLSASSTSR